MAQLVKNPPAMRGDLVSIPGSGRSPGKGKGYPLQLFLGFPGGSAGKEFACSGRDLGSIPGLGRSPGGGHGNPLQCSCLENPRDRGAWWAAVHGAAESRTRLSDSVQRSSACRRASSQALPFNTSADTTVFSPLMGSRGQDVDTSLLAPTSGIN